MNGKIKVLFISAWYPHRYDLMSGLFVRKHAEAVNLYCNAAVLYVHPDENIDAFEIIEQKHNGLREVIVYYPVNTKNIFYKIFKAITYIRAYRKGYKYITKGGFFPDIVHANILTRTGVMAYLLKMFKGIPYVITEHWSRYLPNRSEYNGYIRKKVTERVVAHAAAVLPVSASLKRAMSDCRLSNPNYVVVNNVTDNFFLDKKTVYPRTKKRMLHVSCFDERAKNISGILRTVSKLSGMRNDFELMIIGTGVDFDKVYAYAETLGLPPDAVLFLGEKTPAEVSEWFGNSDFFVMFSNYENSPVVILESLISGKPVVSSDVGGISEHVNDTNGILVPPEDEAELLKSLDYMLDNFRNYDPEKMKREAIEKYTCASVGKKIEAVYLQVLKKDPLSKNN
ncbi:MAG: glycosyltransferase [Prevotellaceae bacterium]|nr:glycosyltransferase [Prevotellaceae bacterium]